MNLFMRLVGLLLCGLLCESVKTLGEYHEWTLANRNRHNQVRRVARLKAANEKCAGGKVYTTTPERMESRHTRVKIVSLNFPLHVPLTFIPLHAYDVMHDALSLLRRRTNNYSPRWNSKILPRFFLTLLAHPPQSTSTSHTPSRDRGWARSHTRN